MLLGLIATCKNNCSKLKAISGFLFFSAVCLLGFWEEKLLFNYLTGHFPNLEHMDVNIKIKWLPHS